MYTYTCSGLAVKGATRFVLFTKEGEEGATVLEVYISLICTPYLSIYLSIYMYIALDVYMCVCVCVTAGWPSKGLRPLCALPRRGGGDDGARDTYICIYTMSVYLCLCLCVYSFRCMCVCVYSGLAVKGSAPIVRFTKEGEEGATVLEVHIYLIYIPCLPIYLSVCVYSYRCIYIYICIYICIHIYIHMYIYIHL